MKLDPILTKASRLARSGKYEAVIRLLQPEVNRYHGSFHYYYLLGVSCLHSGDTGGALTYFRLAHDTNRKNPLAILGLAVLYLRRGETDRSVDLYLDVLELNPKNRTAKRAMKFIRKYAGTESFSAMMLDSGKISSLFPPVPFAGFYRKEILVSIGIFVVLCVIAYGILAKAWLLPNPFHTRGGREGTDKFILTYKERMSPVETGESYSHVLTRIQTLEIYEKALKMFTSHRDDAARVLLNKILESNAAEGIKNRARLIITHLETPDVITFRNRKDNPEFAEVKSDIMLYNGVHIIWRGRAYDVITEGESTSFKFFVGYENLINIKGTVRVVFNRAIQIDPKHPIEVFAKIVPVNTEEGFYLEGINFHQPGFPD